MNVLFLTMNPFASIDMHNIYSDLISWCAIFLLSLPSKVTLGFIKTKPAVSRITTVSFYTASNGQYSLYRLAGPYYVLGCEPIDKLAYLLRCFKDTSIFLFSMLHRVRVR